MLVVCGFVVNVVEQNVTCARNCNRFHAMEASIGFPEAEDGVWDEGNGPDLVEGLEVVVWASRAGEVRVLGGIDGSTEAFEGEILRKIEEETDQLPGSVGMGADFIALAIPHETEVGEDFRAFAAVFGSYEGLEGCTNGFEEFTGQHEGKEGVFGWVGKAASVVIFGAAGVGIVSGQGGQEVPIKAVREDVFDEKMRKRPGFNLSIPELV
ncbi:MAG: hypothetical protein ACREIQ_02170 [Nitrospiria bacterium]